MSVPKNVHPAIKWSKADPLLEAEIFNIQSIQNAILAKSTQKYAKHTSTNDNKVSKIQINSKTDK